jgi:hypothetical protein
MLDAISWELSRASSSKDKVTLEAGVDDLDNDILVCDADDEAVLGGVANEVLDWFQSCCRPITYYLFLACVTRRFLA